MPLSEQERKQYGCWACRYYKPDESHLPLLIKDCFPCSRCPNLSKGPYGPPCDFFALNYRRFVRVTKIVGEELALNRFLLREKAYDIRREQGTLPEFILQDNTHVEAALIFRKKMEMGQGEEMPNSDGLQAESSKRGVTKMNGNEYPLLPGHLRSTAMRCITTAGTKLYVKATLVNFPYGHRDALVKAHFLRKNHGGAQYFFVPPFTKLAKAFASGEITEERLAEILQVGVEEVEPTQPPTADAPVEDCPSILLGNKEISLGAAKILLEGLSQSGAAINASISEGDITIIFGGVTLALPVHPRLK